MGFAGLERDTTTGMNLGVHRTQDPLTRSWTSEDPIGFAAWDANLYRYSHNSPTNVVDPTGQAGKLLPPNNWPTGIKILPQNGWIEHPNNQFYPIDKICSVYDDEAHVGDGKEWPKHYDVEYENKDGKQKIRGKINDDGDWEPIDPDTLPNVPKVVDNGDYVVLGISGAVVAYGCYRLIRLVPSLFPPFWPTLPVNVAAP
jgi:RHS repeat-associated protein